MLCRVCHNLTTPVFRGNLLKKYSIQYYACPTCQFLQAEDPVWLDEAYCLPIQASDTGVMQRNLLLARITGVLLWCLYHHHGTFLDFAGGYGIFTRLMRDQGFDFYWTDPFCQNLLARGFEFIPGQIERFDLITAFEVFEHFVEPREEITQIFRLSSNLLCSTMLRPHSLAKTKNWWYLGQEHGQHIGFYSLLTLRYLAQQHHVHLYSNGRNLHLFTPKRLMPMSFKVMVLLGVLGGSHLIGLFLKSKTLEDFKTIQQQLMKA